MSTTRAGGVSLPPYDSLNLGDHVGDDPHVVAENRALVRHALQLPAEPRWLRQVHGAQAIDGAAAMPCEADACYTHQPGVVCAVLTADCLPVLLCDRAGTRVAAVHAGWRGLAKGIIEGTVDAFGGAGHEVLVWLGPAIGPRAFEVGAEVRAEFLAHNPATVSAFQPSLQGRWLADIYALARVRLASRGVTAVYGGDYCTAGDPARFYSYRRDGVTGRMATLIWLDPSHG